MIHHSVGASRKVARIIGAVSAPLLAVIGGSLPNAASAGGTGAPDAQPALRGSYCEGSDQGLTQAARLGCARISGYIAAGARFGSDERINGRPDPFAPIEEPAIVGGPASGFTIVGGPASGERFLVPASPGETAR
jgi:hypothetical protein